MMKSRPRRALIASVAFGVLASVLVGGAASASPSNVDGRLVVDVTAAPYSAAGDGVTGDRVAIQGALDDVSAAGGGTVVLPAGRTFLTGSISVGSNTTLRVDGVLKQSQNAADYDYQPLFGHFLLPPPEYGGCVTVGSPYPTEMSGTCGIDDGFFHNRPLVYSHHSVNVAIEGSGSIVMTDVKRGGVYVDGETVDVIPIGLHRVSNYAVRDVRILNAHSYNIALFTTDHGVVSGVTIDVDHARPVSTDGISIQNSQHVRITGNTLRTGDDAIYVWSSYHDQRPYQHPNGGTIWWSTGADDDGMERLPGAPQPTTGIEIDHNDIVTPAHGFAFIPWGTGSPEPAAVAISDVRVHDNRISAGITLGCWCDDPNTHGPDLWTYSDSQGNQSSITDVEIQQGDAQGSTQQFVATDVRSDGLLMSSPKVLNGDFELTGGVWWTAKGPAGSTDTAAALAADAAKQAAKDMDGWFGYLQPDADQTAELYEGLGLTADTYTAAAQVVTGPGGAQLRAYDTCTGQELATTPVKSDGRKRFVLRFEVADACGDVQVGLRAAGSDGWALVDNVDVIGSTTLQVIDDRNPSLTYEGSWGQYTAAADWQGTHTTALADGAAVTIPFVGDRATVLGIADNYLGIAEVYLDGALVGTADYYRSSTEVGATIFNTGPIPYGEHTLKLVRTGTKNPASTGWYIDLDGLALAPQVELLPASIAVRPPFVTGPARIGGRLVAHRGVWDTAGLTFTYQWLADGAPIAGATGSSLPLPAELAGKQVSVRVTGSTAGVADGVAESDSVTVPAAAP